MKKEAKTKSGYSSICKACVKLAGAAHRTKNSDKIKKQQAEYREANKEAISVYHKEFRQKNSEKVRAKDKAHRVARKVEISGYQKKYRDNNPDKEAARHAKYTRDNAGMANANTAARRFRIRTAKSGIADANINRFMLQEIYIHSVEISELTGVPHEVDHIVPLKNKNVCGLHVPHNLRVVPREVNRAKGNSFKTMI